VDEEREFETTCLLGTHPTRQDSMIVFPNNLQHQVGELKLLPGATEGRRRVLVLWLVAPGTRVPSTADVPDATLGSKISAAEALEYRELLMIERKVCGEGREYRLRPQGIPVRALRRRACRGTQTFNLTGLLGVRRETERCFNNDRGSRYVRRTMLVQRRGPSRWHQKVRHRKE
jgi:hypothetical protein